MRIIAGRFRSRTIQAPPGSHTRPTTDRVREAVFSMLQSRDALADAAVLDLFAGTGALGLEALSRGAQTATFVEQSRRVVEILKANVAALDVADATSILSIDAFRFVRECKSSYDLVFADPPYRDVRIGELPELVLPIVKPGGFLLLEHGLQVAFESDPRIILSRDFGQTRITLFQAVSSDR